MADSPDPSGHRVRTAVTIADKLHQLLAALVETRAAASGPSAGSP
ncbi:hypothetical protein QRX50_29855 [Amycolatopsis carbonis]|uniref:Uncharacterized protein n=1 Tax=Amycolatopsis carbonis TaxID=715471 RepID=A0A9Y2IC69_9PSEU|nr:hypothetical protein [Amycolatopsis sp. 2-15]WIX75688.1 hypothetical protein QRX50_29855 [Amycolatopsis sp. 2-15]